MAITTKAVLSKFSKNFSLLSTRKLSLNGSPVAALLGAHKSKGNSPEKTENSAFNWVKHFKEATKAQQSGGSSGRTNGKFKAIKAQQGGGSSGDTNGQLQVVESQQGGGSSGDTNGKLETTIGKLKKAIIVDEQKTTLPSKIWDTAQTFQSSQVKSKVPNKRACSK